jgi:hypothetical protein
VQTSKNSGKMSYYSTHPLQGEFIMKACKKGGKVEEVEEKNIDTGEDGETPDEPLKKGGAAKKKAHHAHGGAAKHRLDKRARGGKVGSPAHPLSGAMPKTQRPGFSEKQKIGKSDD